MPDDNERVANSSHDQDDGQDVHEQVTSGVIAELVGDCEGRRRQHEMGQDFHASFSKHEVGDDNANETYDGNEIIDSLHQVRPILRSRAIISRSACPIMLRKRKATANPAFT
jgi:hypothetical protein